MSKRSKADALYLKNRIQKAITIFPELALTENRITAIKAVLQKRYPSINGIPNELIKDIAYVDRRFREVTAKKQVELKKRLSKEFIENEL